MDFRAGLEALGIYNGEDTDWEAFQDAMEQADRRNDLEHEEVLGIFRSSTSPAGGDEIETAGIFSQLQSDELCFYWSVMASGIVLISYAKAEGKEGIGAWISTILASQQYTYYQFMGCEITNYSPHILSRKQVWKMVEAAVERGGSAADLDDGRSLTQWFDDHYTE